MSVFNLDDVQNIMVFGAHPDDEIIGPGGVIHNLSTQGKQVYVVTFTDGGTASNSFEGIEAMVNARKKEMARTDKILGINKREFLQIPSQQVYAAVYGQLKVAGPKDISKDGHMTLHHRLIHLIRKYQPQVLFTHSKDNHRDHCGIEQITPQSVFQASESILEQLGNPWNTPILLYYSVETGLQGSHVPNVIIEIEKSDLDAKLDAMATQISQTREDYLQHFKEMMTGRAALWGAELFGAGRYAEPFHLNDHTPIRINISR